MIPLGDAKRPGSILGNVEELPADSWLYIFESVAEADTLCLLISFDSEDPDDVEQCVKGGRSQGVQEFLAASDLAGLRTNIHVQLHHPPLLSHG